MNLLIVRLVAALNAVHAGLATVPEVEAAVRENAFWVQDPDRLLQMSERLTLRIGLAQMPRRLPGAWALALVTPGRFGGLRGPRDLNRLVLQQPADDDLGAVAVAVRHQGQAAALLGWEEPAGAQGDDLVPVLAIHPAERPLPPATPAEAARALGSAMAEATSALAASGVVAGSRPDPAATVRLGQAYGAANQQLLDRAMTVLALVQAAREGESDLPHSHAVTRRAAALEPLRAAALDAVQAAVSWPAHLMR